MNVTEQIQNYNFPVATTAILRWLIQKWDIRDRYFNTPNDVITKGITTRIWSVKNVCNTNNTSVNEINFNIKIGNLPNMLHLGAQIHVILPKRGKLFANYSPFGM